MTDTNPVASLLDELGAYIKRQHEENNLRELEEARGFDPLSFFKSDEVLSSKILAYFITPCAKHGGKEVYLRALLKALNVPVSKRPLTAVIVLDNVPCFTLNESRLMDILIRFRDGSEEYAIALESKSHGAADQPGQMQEYLRHLSTAYPHRRKYLFYLKDGQPPRALSITAEAWALALADGICSPENYHSTMRKWVDECLAQKPPQKVKIFLSSFLRFIGAEEEPPMAVNRQTEDLVAQIIKTGSADGEISARLHALIDLSVMADFVWETAMRTCLQKVTAELEKQLAGWDMNLCPYKNEESRHVNEFELYLWKIDWKQRGQEDAVVCVFLATWAASISIGWFKRDDVRPLPGMKFTKQGHVILSKAQRVQPARHIGNIRSPEGVRYLLTDQAAMDLVNDLMQFISEQEPRISETVHAASGIKTKKARHK